MKTKVLLLTLPLCVLITQAKADVIARTIANQSIYRDYQDLRGFVSGDISFNSEAEIETSDIARIVILAIKKLNKNQDQSEQLLKQFDLKTSSYSDFYKLYESLHSHLLWTPHSSLVRQLRVLKQNSCYDLEEQGFGPDIIETEIGKTSLNADLFRSTSAGKSLENLPDNEVNHQWYEATLCFLTGGFVKAMSNRSIRIFRSCTRLEFAWILSHAAMEILEIVKTYTNEWEKSKTLPRNSSNWDDVVSNVRSSAMVFNESVLLKNLETLYETPSFFGNELKLLKVDPFIFSRAKCAIENFRSLDIPQPRKGI